MAEDQPIDPTYLPFTPGQLHPHFLRDGAKHIAQFQKSAQAYRTFLTDHPNRAGITIHIARRACQIEKDEQFWTITSLKHLFDAPQARRGLVQVLSRGFGPVPPLGDFADWDACVEGDLRLLFEAPVSSSTAYVSWLRSNIERRHMIPYVLNAARRMSAHALEGRTNVDAVLVNVDNGFTLMVEAKVLSLSARLSRSISLVTNSLETWMYCWTPPPERNFRCPSEDLTDGYLHS